MSVACVALLFATMGGARRMDAHAMTGHGSHFGHIIAQSETVVSHDVHSAHTRHHGAAPHEVDAVQAQEPEKQSSEECTCVGPCQGAALVVALLSLGLSLQPAKPA